MASPSTKILTVGSTVGSIGDLFAKVKAIDLKHGKFDLLLCTGDFFGPPKDDSEPDDDEITQLLNGQLEVPIECYIMQGEYPLPPKVVEKFAITGGELCKNVFLMSKSCLITTASRLRIACVAGIYEPQIFTTAEAAPGFMSPFFSHHTIDRLLSNTFASSSSHKQTKAYSLASIQASSSSSQLIDILLTNTWPSCITLFSETPLPDPQMLTQPLGAPPLDDVVRKTKPRYHFAAGTGPQAQFPKFWEREPFLWDDEQGRASRFISLGSFGGEPPAGKKQRWFYAFNISPNNPTELLPRPPNATLNPFLAGEPRMYKRVRDDDPSENFIFGAVQHPQKKNRTIHSEPGKPPSGYKCRRCDSTEHFINDCPERSKPPENYVCKVCHEPGHFVRDCPTRNEVGDTGGKKPRQGYVCRACGSENHYIEDCLIVNERSAHGERHSGKRGPPKEIAPDECWFCLSNSDLAKHLIVAIGEECYVTLPKGQIIPTRPVGNNVSLPGGGHILIVPITHYPTYSTIPPDLAPAIVEETERYKKSLGQLYAKYHCVPVAFEVARLSVKGGHAHVQVVPIPEKLKNGVEDAFIQEGRLQGIDFEEDAEAALKSCENGRGGYFKVDLPDGKMMVHLMKDQVPFGLQFGRQVLVNLLGMPERMDWKNCLLSEDEDTADAEAFKTIFKGFNLVT